jgi:hypothetical protein
MAKKVNHKEKKVQETKKIKPKKDLGKVATKIMAIILAAIMVLSVAITLIYYIVMAQV